MSQLAVQLSDSLARLANLEIKYQDLKDTEPVSHFVSNSRFDSRFVSDSRFLQNLCYCGSTSVCPGLFKVNHDVFI